jgi:hypothetical protein
MKMLLKFTLVGFVGLVLLGVIAFYVDYYYYSFASYTQPFGCRFKEIAPVEVVLKENYDLVKIGEAINSDSKYEKVYFNIGRVFASRKFEGVLYSIRVDFFPAGNHFTASFSNGNETPREPSTKPDLCIRNNIEQMIEEMPFSIEQKAELKSKVEVRCSPSVRISF